MTYKNKRGLALLLTVLVLTKGQLVGASQLDLKMDQKEIDKLVLTEALRDLPYDIEWKDQERKILVSQGDKTYVLRPNSNKVEGPEGEILLKKTVELSQGKTLVPAEFFDSCLDLIVRVDYYQNKVDLREFRKNNEELFKKSQKKDLEKKLDQYMVQVHENDNLNASILVAEDGEIILNKAYGRSDIKENIDLKTQSRLGIGSISKQFIALSILQLEEGGSLALDQGLDQYLDDFKQGERISIHQLLTHSSGLMNYTNRPEFIEGSLQEEDIMQLVNQEDLLFPPGEGFFYSNTNYYLLGRIIERVTGQDLASYLEENIFKPLDMKDTGLAYYQDETGPDATAYLGYLDLKEVDDRYLFQLLPAAGGLYSTTEDLYRWMEGLKNHRLISPASLEKMFTPHIDMGDGLNYYGYGVMLREDTRSHGGNTLGFTSFLGENKEGREIILLTNTGQIGLDDRVEAIYNIMDGQEEVVEKRPEEVEISSQDLQIYQGLYELDLMGQKMDLAVEEEGGRLFIKLGDQEKIEAFYQGDHSFFFKAVKARMSFQLHEENGDGEYLTFYQLDQGFKGRNKKYIGERPVADLTREDLEKYLGEYQAGDNLRAYISLEEDRLMVRVNQQEALEVYPEALDKFYYKDILADLEFKEDQTSFILSQGGQEIEFTKIK